MINSVSAKKNVSFGSMVPVSYAIVNGQLSTDKKVISDVTRQLVKQIKDPASQNDVFRRALLASTGDTTLFDTGYFVKRMGKFLITGKDAVDVSNIWALKDVDKATKSARTSALIKSLFAKMPHCKLAVSVDAQEVKGRTKYTITNLFPTIY